MRWKRLPGQRRSSSQSTARNFFVEITYFEGKLSNILDICQFGFTQLFTRAAFWILLQKRRARGSGRCLCDLRDNRCRR